MSDTQEELEATKALLHEAVDRLDGLNQAFIDALTQVQIALGGHGKSLDEMDPMAAKLLSKLWDLRDHETVDRLDSLCQIANVEPRWKRE